MKENADRRVLNRIYNPDAIVKYKQKKKTGLFSSYSNKSEILNLSKSGMAIPMHDSVDFGQPVILKISFGDGKTLRLKGHVRWQNKLNNGSEYITGIQFNAFGRSEEYNSPKALEYLRSLDGQAMIKDNTDMMDKH